MNYKKKSIIIGALVLGISSTHLTVPASEVHDYLEEMNGCDKWHIPDCFMVDMLKEEELNRWQDVKEIKYSNTILNIRKDPCTDAEIIGQYGFNDPISVTGKKKNKEYKWIRVSFHGETGYVHKDYVMKDQYPFRRGSVPYENSFKSFMDYRYITDESSRQLFLQQNYAYTGNYGIRMIDNRYCAAIGSYYGCQIGQWFDIVLYNGHIIPCIMADQKADAHTDYSNRQTLHDGSIVEFVVDTPALYSDIRKSGNVGSVPNWDGEIECFRIYDIIK